MQNFWDKAITT